MTEKKMYVVHTKDGYWIGAFAFHNQLRFAKIYTSLRFANETVERIRRAYSNDLSPKVIEVRLSIAQNEPTAEVAREIFEEIEKLAKEGGVIWTNYARAVIAELKKKYTEGAQNES